MDKRLLNFLLISMLIILGYSQLQRAIAPPPPEVEKDGDENVGLVADQFEGEPVEGAVADEAVGPGAPASGSPDDEPDAVTERPAAVPTEVPFGPATTTQIAPQWHTLGSVDPTSPYRMLVTFNNRGAAVERVELSKPRYRDLEDLGAYIGHLALTDDAEGRGCRINVVGAGTPAAVATAVTPGLGAGLQVGDLITTVEGEAVTSVVEFYNRLAELKPNNPVHLVVRRGMRELRFTTTAIRRPLEVIRPEPFQGEPQDVEYPLSYLTTIDEIADRRTRFGENEMKGLPSLRDSYWQSAVVDTPQGQAVEFRYVVGPEHLEAFGVSGSLEFVKRYRLDRVPAEQQDNDAYRAYHLVMEIEILNHGPEPVKVAYRQDGPTGLPLEGWWYSYKTHPTSWGGAGTRDIVWKAMEGRHEMFTNPKIVKQAKQDPSDPDTPLFDAQKHPRLQYVGGDAQYFASALLADADGEPDDLEEYAFRKGVARPAGTKDGDPYIDTLRASRTDVTFRLYSEARPIPAGGKLEQRFEIFAGPKKPELLAEYGLQNLIVYGWFGPVAKVMTKVLDFFYAGVRNYGVAIILLTVLVRGCLFPLGLRMAKNAQKMQELAPEMKKIADKYKNDMEKRSAAQRELFRKHNYNPLSGCLPMFLQLPIFIGLYRALSVDIELRQAPLIPGWRWCSNLAGPDQFLRWDHLLPNFIAGPTGWLGPYLNILPLVSVALFLVQQKMFTPPPTDEQQEIQQRVMKFMTLFIGVLFFKVPSGLCLYFITSSLWGLGERKLLPKPKNPGAETAPPEKITASAESGNGTAKKAAKAKRRQRRR